MLLLKYALVARGTQKGGDHCGETGLNRKSQRTQRQGIFDHGFHGWEKAKVEIEKAGKRKLRGFITTEKRRGCSTAKIAEKRQGFCAHESHESTRI